MINQVRARLKEAMKQKSPDKDILRVFLGKLQQIEADEGTQKLTDERCHAVARSIIKGNKEAITLVETEKKAVPEDWRKQLEAENKVMESFLPNYLTAQEIEIILTQNEEMTMKIANSNEGAAMGIVMKFLKGNSLNVEGNTVKEVVKRLQDTKKIME